MTWWMDSEREKNVKRTVGRPLDGPDRAEAAGALLLRRGGRLADLPEPEPANAHAETLHLGGRLLARV